MTKQPSARPDIRAATAADIDAVSAIYTVEVNDGYATFEESAPEPEVWRAKIESTTNGDHFLVAVDSAGVVGFAYSSPFRRRAAYRYTRETSVYVDRAATGQGVGKALYAELTDLLRADGIRVALAGIALPNPGSVRLHESMGYSHLGTMAAVGNKFDTWIDVGWWQADLLVE